MSPKLELTELIEKYLRNELPPQERLEFEKRMNADPKLQQEVSLQREVMQGIERAALKQKAQKAWKYYKTGKNLWNWGLSGFAIMLVAGAIMYYMNSSSRTGEVSNELPALNEKGNTNWADADRILPGQKFTIDSQKDTVIITEGGIVMVIPANAFIDENGQPATGTVEFEVKEALDPATIIKAGLSTHSGDQLLETGGMFYINARKDGRSLKIDPGKGIYTEVPASEAKPGMMLFEGERRPDGSINWINPKQLVHELLPADILSLNFYPPNYLDSLENMGYDRKNKKFTDSLYYSFAAEFSEKRFVIAGTSPDPAVNVPEVIPVVGVLDTASRTLAGSNQLVLSNYNWPSEAGGDTLNYTSAPKGINPAKVQAIWNKQFRNTLLSTREFEMRMKHIHQSCTNAVLDLYVNNLDKNLCTIDSMAANIAGDQREAFMKFGARGDGKVSKPAKHLDKLRELYDKRSKAVTEAIAKTHREFWSEQRKLDNESAMKKQEYINNELQRKSENYAKELKMNLDEAYRQLGISRNAPVPGTPVNTALITGTGWWNVDKYVTESTLNRTTLDYTDPNTGKKAIIKYTPISVKVNERTTYDRVFVYLLPDKLNSFMRMKWNGDTYTESLNELMSYKLVALGYKGDAVYLYTQEVMNLNSYTIDLFQTTPSKAEKQIAAISNMSIGKSMAEQIAFQSFDIKDAVRQKMVRGKEKLRDRIRPVVFPCDAGLCNSGEPISNTVAAKIFRQNCAVCHSTGTNTITGPGLAGIAYRIPSKDWFYKFVINPDAMKKTDAYAAEIDKKFPSNMTGFAFFSECEIEAIYQYLENMPVSAK